MTRPVFSSPAERIMVAVDVDELDDARRIAQAVSGLGVTLKIGNQLGTWVGWEKVIDLAHEFDVKIFCDTKFKDIPQTVELSSRSMTRHQPDFFNIMADTQPDALVSAVTGRDSAMSDFGLSKRPILLGVTVLTSIDNAESSAIYGAVVSEKVKAFAEQAAKSGLDGVVCSAQEATSLRSHDTTNELVLVTPGIRPAWATANDQSRIVTPKQAIEMGTDYLVIGRPITQPPSEIGSPRDAILKIIEELS